MGNPRRRRRRPVPAPRRGRAPGGARTAHGLPQTAPLLLAVGRLNIQKNLHTLLRLLAAVCREVPDAHLCFAGEEDDIGLHEFGVLNTGYVAWLEGQAAGLGLADAITFTGPLLGEELAGLYAAADVVVSASVYHRENGGLAPAEAQACGVPVVCTAWGGFKDVVQDGETGYLMDAVLTGHGIRVDWATGAARTVALLRDPTRRAAMGARAATRARERYGLAAFSRALAGIVAGAGTPASPPPGGARPDGAGTSDARGEAYAPSAFAARLEAHKRAAGWYGPRPGARRGRRVVPGMFQGRDYRLYERLMEPYATRPAAGLEAGAIAPDWVPYFPSPVTLDHDRALAQDDDPIWPHRRFCRPDVWAVLCRVDGAASVGEIAAAAGAGGPPLDLRAVAGLLAQLHLEGFVLFRRDGANE